MNTINPTIRSRFPTNILSSIKTSSRRAFWLALAVVSLLAVITFPLTRGRAESMAPVAGQIKAGRAADPAASQLMSYAARPGSFEPVPFTIGVCDTAGPIEVEASLTGLGPTAYATLKAAFDAINAGTHTGAISVEVCGNTTETATAVLNASGSGSASYSVIVMRPSGGVARTVSGSIAGPLIDLNGADNVSINGLNLLTIENTNTGTTASTIRLINDATLNTITNNTINGSSTGTAMQTGGSTAPTGATILIGGTTGTTGNDNNNITSNNIGPAGANLPVAAISSAGQSTALANDTLTITGNYIYDFYGASGANGVAVANSSAFDISSNQFYETASRSGLASASYWEAIIVSTSSGGGYTVNNNIIGFATNSATGLFTNSGGRFVGIDLTAVAASPVSNVQGNTINGINWTTASSAATLGAGAFNPIIVKAGGVNIGTTTGNTIGAISGTGTAGSNIFVTTTSSGSGIYPIYVTSSTACSIANNKIGAIGTGGTAAVGYTFTGIAVAGSGSHTISTNEVGNGTSGSVQLGIIGTTTATSTVIGITTAATGATNIGTIAGTGNSVQNIAMNAAATNAFTGISNTGAGTTVNLNFNTIKGIVFGATGTTHSSTFNGILNGAAVTTALNINSNSLGIVGSGLVSYNLTATAASGVLNGVNVSTGPASAAPMSISSNDFRGITYASAGSGNITFINYTHTASATDNINSNTFTNMTVNTTGNVTFIARAGSMTATGVENINNNSIVTQFNKSAAGGTVTYFTGNASSVAGSAMSNTGNNFSNLTVTGATTVAGWSNTEGSSGSGGPAKTITGNTFGTIVGGSNAITGLTVTFAQAGTVNVSNNTFSGWQGTGAMTAMSVGASCTGTQSYSNNTIAGLTSNGTGGLVIGITAAPAGGTATFGGNNINNLSTTGATSLTGFLLTTAAPTTNITKNKIYDFIATNASAAVSGLAVSPSTAGATINTINNLVGNLTATAATGSNAVMGINISGTGTTQTNNVYYNSVYLNAVSSGTGFGSSGIFHTVNTTSTTGALNLRNNIIVNTSTPTGSGSTVAYRRSGGAANNLANYASTSNNNDFYAGTPSATRLIYSDGTSSAQTMAAYRAGVFTAGTIAPRDSASFSEDPEFQSTIGPSANFLKFKVSSAKQIESGAVNIAGATDDVAGTIRQGNAGYAGTGNSPDVGAWELEGITLDLTAPIISYTTLGTGANGATRSFTGVTITDGTGVNGTAGTRPRVYYKKTTDTNNTFNDNTSATVGWKYVEANGASSPFDFTIDYSKLSGGGGVAVADVIQYFVVAQDTSPTVNVAINSGTFAATPTSVNLTAAAFPIGGTINTYTIAAAITGTKTVCSSGCDFTTLTGASGVFNAINTSVATGNINIEIGSNLTAETGAIALNQLAEDTSGSNFTVKIYPTGVGPWTIFGSVSSNGLVRLNGADRVTIDGSLNGTGTDRNLTITNNSSTAPTSVSLISLGTGLGATSNTIKNCNIIIGMTPSLSYGIAIGGSTPGTTGADNDNNTVQNNNIGQALIGIYAFGTAAVTSGGNDNLAITGNTVDYNGSLTSIGIQLGGALNSSVSQNIVSQLTSAVQSPTGISLETNFVSSTVSRNTVTRALTTHTGGYGGRGITVGTGTASSALTLSNNVVYGVNGSNFSGFENSSAMGIAIGMIGNSSTITTTAGGINLYFNSVNMTGSMGNGSTTAITTALYVGTGASALNIRNNVLVNTQTGTATGQKNYAIYSAAANTAFTTINYNDYYVANSFNAASAIPGFITSDRTNLAGIQTGFGGNANSLVANPLFNSTTNLQPQAGSPVLGAATPIAGFTHDFSGIPRNPVTPTIGAYETAQDTSGPVITYTAFINTSSTLDRTLAITATDVAGVPTSGAGLPVLYFRKGTSGAYSASTCSFVSGSSYNCSTNYAAVGGVVLTDTIQYYVAAQDNLGNVSTNPSAGAAGFTTNPPAASTPPTTPDSYLIVTGYSGTLTVGSGGMFPSLTNTGGLFQTLNNNVLVGNVSIDIVSDLTGETGTVLLAQQAEEGAGAGTYTVTIRPSGAPRSITSTTGATRVIGLFGADRVTIDGSTSGGTDRSLTIINSNATASNTAVVGVYSLGVGAGATNNTIKNCVIQNGTNFGTVNSFFNYGILVAGNGVFPGPDNDNLTIQNNLIQRALIGIQMDGGAAPGVSDNLVISGNTIGGTAPADYIGLLGTQIGYLNGAVVDRNTVRNILWSAVGDGAGIYVFTDFLNSSITRNTISNLEANNSGGYGMSGIWVNTGNAASGLTIANNFIYDIRGTGWTTSVIEDTVAGIRVAGSGPGGVKIWNNSVNLYGDYSGASAATVSAALMINATTPTGLDIRNNILRNTFNNTAGAGDKSYAIYTTTANTMFTDNNYNDYFVSGTPGVLGAINATDATTIAALRTATGKDAQSIAADPLFTSMTDLHIGSASPARNAGTTVAGVTNDYDGDARPQESVYEIGADEYVDSIAPDTTIDSNPPLQANVNTATFTFSGTDSRPAGGTKPEDSTQVDNAGGQSLAPEAVASFECSLDGASFTSCTSPQMYSSLIDGLHTFQVRAKDAGGNIDPTPASYTWLVDTTPPTTTILTSPPNPSPSNNATFTFSGNDGSGSGVAGFSCQLDGGGFAPCTSPKNYSGLSDGIHHFNVKAIDAVGNSPGSVTSYNWRVDTTEPNTNITANPSDPTNSTSASFTFTGTDSGSGIGAFVCRIDGGGYSACTSPANFAGLSAGSHTFDVKAVDNAGNTDSSEATFTWTIDLTAPAATYTPLGTTGSAAARPLTVSATDNLAVGSVSVFYAINGGSFSSVACTPSGGSNYTCTIPGQAVGSSVAYYVSVADTATNTSTTPSASQPNYYSVGIVAIPAGTYTNAAIFNGSTLGGNVTIVGNLNLSGGIVDAGVNTLSLGCNATVSGAGNNNYVIGNVLKDFCVAGSFTFPVGTTPNGAARETEAPGEPTSSRTTGNARVPEGTPAEYTPMTAFINSGTFPSSLTVSVTDTWMPGTSTLNSLSRYWNVTETGTLNVTMTFQYLDEDPYGNEAAFSVVKNEGVSTTTQPGSVNAALNQFTATNVTNFSRWGAGLLPTAAGAKIGGRVLDAYGRPIAHATVLLSGGNLTQPVLVQTGPFGYYTFEGLEVGRLYIVTVSSGRHSFAEPSRAIDLSSDIVNADFVANP